jgi:hypothetical protein
MGFYFTVVERPVEKRQPEVEPPPFLAECPLPLSGRGKSDN